MSFILNVSGTFQQKRKFKKVGHHLSTCLIFLVAKHSNVIAIGDYMVALAYIGHIFNCVISAFSMFLKNEFYSDNTTDINNTIIL